MIPQLWCFFGVRVSGIAVCCGICVVCFFFQGGNTVGIYVDVPYGVDFVQVVFVLDVFVVDSFLYS